jgi:ABC-type transport system substrate-binding protein
VDGYYGIEQWEYLLITGQLDYPIVNDPENPLTDEQLEEETAKWEALSLDNLVQYHVDLDKANELLDKAGWTLNRDGEPYRKGVDDVRCKEVDGELTALDLKMMYPAGNHIVDTIQENFIDNLNKVGILLTLVPTDMQELFYAYYRETERTTDMIYLATNFHVIVDPSITYSCDPTADHLIWNNTYSDDEELWLDAVDMRKTEPGAVYEYVTKWITFQERYNEVLPCIPLYSNIYFDFFTGMLQNYHITAHVTWTQAILESYFGEPPEEEEGDADFGEIFMDGEGFEVDDEDVEIDD